MKTRVASRLSIQSFETSELPEPTRPIKHSLETLCIWKIPMKRFIASRHRLSTVGFLGISVDHRLHDPRIQSFMSVFTMDMIFLLYKPSIIPVTSPAASNKKNPNGGWGTIMDPTVQNRFSQKRRHSRYSPEIQSKERVASRLSIQSFETSELPEPTRPIKHSLETLCIWKIPMNVLTLKR